MLDRKTGKVLHIDFGDCFEVAMQREKFPEKVPFRLTRMLVNAMEVAGIEGNYRSTCENVSSFLFAVCVLNLMAAQIGYLVNYHSSNSLTSFSLFFR